jgi:hypothetical protein
MRLRTSAHWVFSNASIKCPVRLIFHSAHASILNNMDGILPIPIDQRCRLLTLFTGRIRNMYTSSLSKHMLRDYKYILVDAIKTTIDTIDNSVNHSVTVDAGILSLQHLFNHPP